MEKTVRETIGPNKKIRLDTNMSWNIPQARKLINKWNELHLKWCDAVQLIKLDDTLGDNSNISDMLELENAIWNLACEFKDNQIDLPDSMQNFKTFLVRFKVEVNFFSSFSSDPVPTIQSWALG